MATRDGRRPTATAGDAGGGRRRRRRRGVAGDGGRERGQGRDDQHESAQQRRPDGDAHDETRRDRRLAAHRQRAYQYHSVEGATRHPRLRWRAHDRPPALRAVSRPDAPAAGAADRAGRRADRGRAALVRGPDHRRHGARGVADGRRAARRTRRRRPPPSSRRRPPDRASPERDPDRDPEADHRARQPAARDAGRDPGAQHRPAGRRRHPTATRSATSRCTSTTWASRSRDLGQPGRGIATYLFAHARDGMFGPIYENAIVKHQPEKMLGMIVQVYTDDNRLYLYEVRKVLLHQLTPRRRVRGEQRAALAPDVGGPQGDARQDPAQGAAAVGRRTRARRTRTPRPSPSAATEAAPRRLDPVDPPQEERGERRAQHDERRDRPEPAALAGRQGRSTASLMPKIPATAPIPARITVTPVSRFMIDRQVVVDRGQVDLERARHELAVGVQLVGHADQVVVDVAEVDEVLGVRPAPWSRLVSWLKISRAGEIARRRRDQLALDREQALERPGRRAARSRRPGSRRSRPRARRAPGSSRRRCRR